MEQIRISWRWPGTTQFCDPKIYNGIDDLTDSDLGLGKLDMDAIKKMPRGKKIRIRHNAVELKIEKL